MPNEIVKIDSSSGDELFGVLSSGEPYLTTEALATACGVTRQAINQLGGRIKSAQDKGLQPKDESQLGLIFMLMRDRTAAPFYELKNSKNTDVNCWHIDSVIPIIQYYAFSGSERARKFSTSLLQYGLVQYIYEKCDYKAPEDTTALIEQMFLEDDEGKPLDHKPVKWD
jgi:hypothetical protein